MPAAVRKSRPTRPDPVDRKYALGIWGLMVAGVVFVFSASYPRFGRPDADGNAGNPFTLLYDRLQDLGVALAVMIIASLTRPETIRRFAKLGLVVTIAAMCMTFIPGVGVMHGGAPRWVKLPFIPEFQPSEFAKIAFIAFIALALARKDEGDDTERNTWLTLAAATGIMVVLLLAQSDQGMATIFVIIALLMAFLAGADGRWLTGITTSLFIGGLVYAHHVPYRWKRITAFLNPEGDMGDTSYQIIRMLIALSRGGVAGHGLGLSPDKWASLPEPYTDSIFSVIGGELGLLGGLAMLAAVGYLTWRALDIARRSRSTYGWYLAAGAAVALGIQAVLHIAVNTSMIPCTGLTLPFISHGGSSLISAAALAGIVLSVSRFTRPETVPR